MSDTHQANLTEEYSVGFNDVTTTPLGLAVFKGDKQALEQALADGIDWEKEHISPLEGAIMGLDTETAQKLIKVGSPITMDVIRTAYFTNNQTILSEITINHTIVDLTPKIAVTWANIVTVNRRRGGDEVDVLLLDFFLHHGANPNQKASSEQGKYKDWPLLNITSHNCSLPKMMKLVESGANINNLTPQGYSPLYCCALSKDYFEQPNSKRICQDYLLSKGGEFIPQPNFYQRLRLALGKTVHITDANDL